MKTTNADRFGCRVVGILCFLVGALTGCATTSHHSVRYREYSDETPGQVSPEERPSSEYRMQSPGKMVSPGEMTAPGRMVDDRE